jgi:hypothetical protein
MLIYSISTVKRIFRGPIQPSNAYIQKNQLYKLLKKNLVLIKKHL